MPDILNWLYVGNHVLYNCPSCDWSGATILEIDGSDITVVHEGEEFQATIEELKPDE